MIDGRLEAHEIADRLWEEHDGIREQIREVLDLEAPEVDEIPTQNEILAAVCVHYLMRIFGVDSRMRVSMNYETYSVELEAGDHRRFWQFQADVCDDLPVWKIRSINGLPGDIEIDEGYGIATYIYAILYAQSKDMRVVTYTPSESAIPVWERLIELGIAEPHHGKFWAQSQFFDFLTEDASDDHPDYAYERLAKVAQDFSSKSGD